MDTMDKATDDSAIGNSREIPNNMDATQTDLPHIRDSSDSTAENIYDTEDCNADNEVQYQLKDKCRETSAAAYQNAGDVDDTSVSRSYFQVTDVENKAEDFGRDGTRPETVMKQSNEAESSKKDKAEDTEDDCITPYAVASGNNDGEQEDVYVAQPYVVAYNEQSGYRENQTPTGRSGNNPQSENRAVANDDCIRPYQRDAKTNGDQEDGHDVQLYAVACNEQSGYHENQTPTGISGNNPQSKNRAATNDECIRPYAVGYQRDAETNGDQEDVHDVQPYAIAYDEQEGHYEKQTPTGRSADSSVCGRPGTSAFTYRQDDTSDIQPYAVAYEEEGGHYENPVDCPAGRPHSVCGQRSTSADDINETKDGLRPNPMYSGNALRSNPMYAPNAGQAMANGGNRCVVTRTCLAGVITMGVVVATMAVLSALIVATLMSGKQDDNVQTTWTDPTFMGNAEFVTDATRHMDYTPSTQTSPKGTENDKFQQTKIEEQTATVFGEYGEEPGQLDGPTGVVVSPSNEIFVADTINGRVQVFSMTGVYLRHFPTVGTLEPEEISIDAEGHLWVVGDNLDSEGSLIGRYTEMGVHITTVCPSLPNNTFQGIAVDTLRNLVVVSELWDHYGEVKFLSLNGTVVQTLRMRLGSVFPGRVAVGREGSIFVSDHKTEKCAYALNETGHYRFSFGGHTDINGGDQMIRVTGLCTDRTGHVLVADWYCGTVDMFTENGRYVRRVTSGRLGIDSIAVGPGGQLVGTNQENSTVTIFSHY
ncbi:uncharacterized protein LOC144880753 [Branchiostoma floridae x Branchiostoma japonicum]